MLFVCTVGFITAQFPWLYCAHKSYWFLISLNIICEFFAFCLIFLCTYLKCLISWSPNPNEFYKSWAVNLHLFNILEIIECKLLLLRIFILVGNFKSFYLLCCGVWKFITCIQRKNMLLKPGELDWFYFVCFLKRKLICIVKLCTVIL